MCFKTYVYAFEFAIKKTKRKKLELLKDLLVVSFQDKRTELNVTRVMI